MGHVNCGTALEQCGALSRLLQRCALAQQAAEQAVRILNWRSLIHSRGEALFAGFNRYGQAVFHRWQRATGVGRVGAGGILEAVEVEDQLAGLVETMIGKRRVEITAAGIGGLLSGLIADDEEQGF